ncbi:MAG: hypothetical protein AAF790_03615, partial [Planctomycetota bacterium]
MKRLNAIFASAALLAAATPPAAYATFPPQPIDCGIFDFESEDFVGHNFAFATNLTYSELGQDTKSTGFWGFVASPEQVSQVPDFVSDTDLPIGLQDLDGLFDPTAPLPNSIQDAFISQSISGVGDLSDTFSFNTVTVSQSSFYNVSQDSGGFADIRGEGKAYFPFDVFSDGGGLVDVSLSIDLFSLFGATGEGFLSESLFVGLIDVTDPDNPSLMDAVSGVYFADASGVDAQFSRGPDGETDISESLFSGSFDDGLFSSFFYEVQTQLESGGTYAIGIVGDGSTG